MDLAFIGAGALGAIGFVASLVIAIVLDGGKVGRPERALVRGYSPGSSRGQRTSQRRS